MAYHAELLDAAERLIARSVDGQGRRQRGKISDARIRRSISTSYYAIFHFMADEVGQRVVGTHNYLRRRRRMLARALTHSGLKVALGKLRASNPDSSIVAFVESDNAEGGDVAVPGFVQELARAFWDAQTKRHDADYNLNEPLSETDARRLQARVKRCIETWQAANTPADRDFKHAVCITSVRLIGFPAFVSD